MLWFWYLFNIYGIMGVLRYIFYLYCILSFLVIYFVVERLVLKIELLDKEKLVEVREKWMKEIVMFDIVWEIVFYFVFVVLIVFVVSYNRDKKVYSVKEVIDNIIDIKKINNVGDGKWFFFSFIKLLL